MVAALFVVTFSVSNPFAAFGVFLPVLSDVFGWSRGAISVALSINLMIGGIVGFGIGATADRYGPRLPLTVTVMCAGVGFALASRVETLWHFYLSVGVMAGIGMSGFYVLSTSTVSRWFERQRGLALATVLIGFNLGFMTGGPLAAQLIQHLGWRSAYVVFGVGVCLTGGLASLLVRFPTAAERAHSHPTRERSSTHTSGDPLPSRIAPPGSSWASAAEPLDSAASGSAVSAAVSVPGSPSGSGSTEVMDVRAHGSVEAPGGTTSLPHAVRLPSGGVAFRTALSDRRLWFLTVGWLLQGFTLLMVSVHVVPYARDRGISLESAALTLTAYGIGAVIGRLGFGSAADRFGGTGTMRLCFAIQMVALLPFLLAPTQAVLLVLVLAFGIGFAGADTLYVKAAPDVFGVRALGAIMGVLTLGWRTGAALGPPAAGFVHDATGAYTVPFGAAPITTLASFVLFMLAERRPR